MLLLGASAGKNVYCGIICFFRRRLIFQRLLNQVCKKMKTTSLFLLLLHWPLLAFGVGLCPPKCVCDKTAKSFDCTDSDLDGIPVWLHPEMKVFKASNAKISKLEGNVNIYTHLEVLDLSGNQFTHLGQDRFADCEKLQQLNVSNNFIGSLHPQTFQGPKSMQTLDLSKNTLTTLASHTFQPLETLVDLRLSRNKINNIEPAAFEGLQRLRVLYLDHNLLQDLNKAWFEPLKNLRFLYLNDNLLRTLPAFTFRPLKALQILDLKANKIHNISDEAFYAIRSVDTLDLSENLLSSVPATPLASLSNLANLALSANPIQRLDAKAFLGMYVLKKLNLDNMYQLASIHLHTFVENMQLRHLSLSNNGLLQPLPWGLFSANLALSELNFVNNTGWNTLSPHQLPLRSIQRLQISGIPFYCNCSLTWLWELYQHQNTTANTEFTLDTAICSSVSNAVLSDVALKEVKVDDLACADWTFVLLVASISILVTVTLLVLLALLAYKCKQKHSTYYASSSSPCLHIKDDTMIYTRPRIQPDTESNTYAKALGGGYSPPNHEPFYEVPRFTTTSSRPAQTGQGQEQENDTGSSKYSSSGYVGSELWENDFLGLNSQIHFGTQRVSRSSGTQSGSSTSSSTAGSKPVFYSPARNFNNYHQTLMYSANSSPSKYPYYNKYVQPQQHHLVTASGTSVRSPKGQHQRNNVYV